MAGGAATALCPIRKPAAQPPDFLPGPDAATRLVQEVFAASLAYSDFILQGEPVCFDVPARPETVISGLRLGKRILVRRTDFSTQPGEITLKVDGKPLIVPPGKRECRVITIPANP